MCLTVVIVFPVKFKMNVLSESDIRKGHSILFSPDYHGHQLLPEPLEPLEDDPLYDGVPLTLGQFWLET